MIFYFELFHKFFKSVRNHRVRGRKERGKISYILIFSHYRIMRAMSFETDAIIA